VRSWPLANAEAPQLPVVSAQTLAAIEEAQRTSTARFIAAAGGVGMLALFISAIGLYAVIAFAVGQRAREIGIRTALGADRRQLIAVFLFQGVRLSVVGLTIGLAISLAVLRMMSAATGTDASVGFALPAAVAGVVTAVALLATWIPARRAASINPLEALHTE
jgi:ABC-type antimicrobial peptide transport system permease subunit